MTILNFKAFMNKYNLKKDTMNESQLQKFFFYPIYLENSKIYSDRGFVNIDDGRLGGTHWCVFALKN